MTMNGNEGPPSEGNAINPQELRILIVNNNRVKSSSSQLVRE